jgi:hypothetical protein
LPWIALQGVSAQALQVTNAEAICDTLAAADRAY